MPPGPFAVKPGLSSLNWSASQFLNTLIITALEHGGLADHGIQPFQPGYCIGSRILVLEFPFQPFGFYSIEPALYAQALSKPVRGGIV
jgi:hypothetical protein